MLSNEDCFLRLPCREDLYESQEIPETPYFAMAGQGLNWQEHATLGNMAHLIAIASAWSDVLQSIYRTKHRAIHAEHDAYEVFYGERQRQLQAFTNRLPTHWFPSNTPKIERALQSGYLGSFICLHALYHTTQMKLNRHALQDDLKEKSLGRNLRVAQFHARELLKITQTMSELQRAQSVSELAGIFSTPFLGYSILSAVDTLTSIGSLVDLKSDLLLVQSSLGLVEELGKYWAGAQEQFEVMAVRFREMTTALQTASVEDIVFCTTEPMDDPFGKELDLLFSPPVEDRLRGLGLGMEARRGKGVLSIKTPGLGIRDYGS